MVCQSLLVEATALQCAHTFCASCIATWLARAAHCPACRAPVGVLEAPVRLRSVDAVARGLAAALPPAERDAWHARQQEAARRRVECEAAAERLRASIAAERARAGAAGFLRVGAEAWTRQEADNFREGAGYYDGAARDVFCASVGLTRALVAEAGPEQLETAALNLGLPLGEGAEGARAGRAARTSELRRRLWLFLCWNYRGARL